MPICARHRTKRTTVRPGERHTGERQADAAQRSLDDRRQTHAERNAADGVHRQDDQGFTLLSAEPECERNKVDAYRSPYWYMKAAKTGIRRS